jgi:hypothetical protein
LANELLKEPTTAVVEDAVLDPKSDVKPSRIADVLMARPDRIAASWRRLCWSHRQFKCDIHLLDGVVESFVQELGRRLQGTQGSAWGRTTGVLRLSRQRGEKALALEFHLLQRCLLDALNVLGGSEQEQNLIRHAILEAAESALTTLAVLENRVQKGPRVPFKGLVVELFERLEANLDERAGQVHTA